MAEGKVTIDVNLKGAKAETGIGRLKQSIQNLEGAGKKLGSTFKSVLGANLISAGIISSIQKIKSGISGMVSELDNSTKAWKTFDGNMNMLGKSSDEINKAKTAMQDYATKTIYSASDMAQTYSQLAAVGIKNTDKLVTGFGGLAAAAENPTQAMKTLSTQAVQMAAKPTVAWMDFKLMLEQTPAGISAVAKQMGMTTSELVKNVQDGKIATQDFFDAISAVGNNADFSKMATEFKTVGQAIDGAKESIAVKLIPAFEKLNKFGIKIITSLTDKLDKLDFEKIAEKLGNSLEKINIEGILNSISTSISNVVKIAKELWQGLNDSGAVSAVVSAFSEVQKAISGVIKNLSDSGVIKTVANAFGQIVKVIAKVVEACAKFINSLPPSVIKGITYAIVGLVGSIKGIKLALKGLDFIKSFNPFSKFKTNATKSIDKVASGAGKSSGIIKKAFQGISKVVKSLGKGLSQIAKGLGQGLATAFKGLGQGLAAIPPTTWLAIGGAILLVCGGLYLLSLRSEEVKTVLLALGETVSMVVTSLAGGLSQIITSIGTAIATVLGGIKGVLEGIATVIVSVGEAIKSVFEGIASVISSVAEVITAVLTGLAGIFSSIFNGIAEVVRSVGDAIKTALEGVATVLDSVGGVVEKFGEAVKNVFEGAGEVIEKFGEAAKNILDGIANIITSIGDAAYDAGAGFNLLSVGIERLTNLSVWDMAGTLAALATGLGAVTVASNGLGEASANFNSLLNSMNGLSGAVNNVIGSFDGFSGAIIGSMNGVASSISSTVNVVQSSIFSIVSAFQNSGVQAVSGFANSFNQLLPIVANVGSNLISEANRIGNEFSNRLANAIKDGISKCQNAMQDMVNSIKNRGEQGVPLMQNVGMQLSRGLANGMLSALGEVRSAANQLVAEAERAAQAKAQIHSPSRLFKNKVGLYMGQGVAVGIDESSKFVEKSIGALTSDISKYKVNISDVLGGNLNSRLRVKYDTYNVEKESTVNSNQKTTNLLNKAFELVDKALNRDVVLVADNTRLAKSVEPHITSIQNKDKVRVSRKRGEL